MKANKNKLTVNNPFDLIHRCDCCNSTFWQVSPNTDFMVHVFPEGTKWGSELQTREGEVIKHGNYPTFGEALLGWWRECCPAVELGGDDQIVETSNN